ncbi:MAG: FAD-dependent oxidoreductase [Gammaproteobacteria bacterium]|nr:FAD-dependent oxidoreductase [Gammaproteobacteria bacterium]
MAMIIIGSGPAALACALALLRLNQQVILITKQKLQDRGDFIRPQRTTMHPETIAVLKTYLVKEVNGARRYLDAITQSNTSQIKDVERYLFDQIQQYADNIIIKDHIHEILKIDLEQKYLLIENNNRYDFQYLIIAEGSRREVIQTHLLGYGFRVTDMGLDYRHPYHATISLKQSFTFSNPHRSLKSLEQDHYQVGDLALLRAHGWEEEYPPLTYSMKGERDNEVVVTGEIPKLIYDIEDKNIKRKLLVAWAKTVLMIQMNIETSELNIKETTKHDSKKLNLRCMDFKTNGMQQVEPGHLASQDHGQKINGGVFLLGDALIASFYPRGYGLNYAIQLADYLGQLIGGQITYADYCHKEEEYRNNAINLSRKDIIDGQNKRIEELQGLITDLEKDAASAPPEFQAIIGAKLYENKSILFPKLETLKIDPDDNHSRELIDKLKKISNLPV